jgi:hypothetical protein
MKTSLRFTLSALTIAFPVTVFGGLVGIIPAAAFVGAVFLYAAAGLTLVALNDSGLAHRPFIVHRAHGPVRTVAAFREGRSRSSYEICDQHCPVA